LVLKSLNKKYFEKFIGLTKGGSSAIKELLHEKSKRESEELRLMR
jgi:hypothetical protein